MNTFELIIFEDIEYEIPLNRRIIFTNGIFDLLHLGHFKLLEFCKEYKDDREENFVVVGLNDDSSAKLLKGDDRPFYTTISRRFMLESLKYVDLVIPFGGVSVIPLLKSLRPHVIIKGGTTDLIEGREFVESIGGEVVHWQNMIKINDEIISTTRILNDRSL